jgi:hypothetical protein
MKLSKREQEGLVAIKAYEDQYRGFGGHYGSHWKPQTIARLAAFGLVEYYMTWAPLGTLRYQAVRITPAGEAALREGENG